MIDFDKILKDIRDFEIKNVDDLETFRLKYLSKKGLLSKLFEDFKNFSSEEKRIYGKKLNEIKYEANNIYNTYKHKFFLYKHPKNFQSILLYLLLYIIKDLDIQFL